MKWRKRKTQRIKRNKIALREKKSVQIPYVMTRHNAVKKMNYQRIFLSSLHHTHKPWLRLVGTPNPAANTGPTKAHVGRKSTKVLRKRKRYTQKEEY